MKRKLVVGLMTAMVILGVFWVKAAKAVAEQDLIVSAAASLTNAFQEIGQKFSSANPGTKVVPNFAASGALLQQIENGAPVDVFASADQKTMDQANEKKLILPETRKNLASNGLVLIIPLGSGISIKSPKDLGAKEISKVGLGNPDTVPAGRYTREALTNEGLWEELNPKFIPADSVRQVLDYVGRGEVDAGFVFATDAAIARDKMQVVATLAKHKPILYPVAVVAATQKKDLAQRFIDFVLSNEGQEILSKYGFGKP
jgi:molybdate transport system substrate-binding protein